MSIGSSGAASKVAEGAKAGVKFGADEDEEEEAKKRRVLVKLDYGEGLSAEEKEKKRLTDLAKLRTQKVPRTQQGLWSATVYWDGITEVSEVF